MRLFLRVWYWLIPLSLLLFFAWTIQFSQPFIIGADGFLHGRMAIMVKDHGFLQTLPQAHFSWFATKFSDKDFLYHVFLVPWVSFFGYMTGTKIGAFVGTAMLYGSVVWVITKSTASRVAPLSSLLLLLAGQFLRDTAEARPFIFAMALTVVGLYILIQGKPRRIFFVSLLYGMTHLSAWLLPFFAGIIVGYDWLQSGKFAWRSLVASVGGYLLSFLIHPNFPNNIFYFYLNGILVPYYAAKTGVLELGAEFFPLYTHQVVRYFFGLIGGGIYIASLGMVTSVKHKRSLGIWTIALLVFGFMALVSRRNMTHLYPVFVVWVGLVVGGIHERLQSLPLGTSRRVVSLGILGSLVLIGFGAFQTVPVVQESLLGDRIYADHFARVSSFINSKISPGSRIFHSNWSDTQFFIGMAPSYEYFVTFDPIYMYSWNKELYQLYRSVSFGGQPDPYKTLKETFGVQYGYAGKNYFTALIEQVRKDKRFTILGEDEMGVIFSL